MDGYIDGETSTISRRQTSSRCSSLQLVFQLLPGDFHKPFQGYASLETIRLCVALPEVYRVKIVLVIQASLDEALDAKNSRRI